MDSFSIAQLSQFSGIKPFTIRMWEQRYNALRPKRTDGNTRTYDSVDLRRILNIVSLQDAGYKISEIGGSSDADLNQKIGELYNLDSNQNLSHFIPQLISAGMEFNERAFCSILTHCIAKSGLFITYKNIIYPLLNRIGLLWSSDVLPPAQEHFMSNLIRQKLIAEIDALPTPNAENKKGLLFLPEDEFHEISLLFAQFILKNNGFDVISLGANVPLPTLGAAIERIDPEFVLLFFVHYDRPRDVELYLSEIEKIFPRGMIYISGNEKLVGQLELSDRVLWIRQIDDMQQILY